MAENKAAFIGSIPENYDKYMVPMFFEPYATDLVSRLNVGSVGSVLELACGTGAVTRKLRDHLPRDVNIVATDLNQGMLDRAAEKFGSDEMVEFRQADASDLPFEDRSFDAVVCQFGLMFVPEKARAVAEAYRVLRPQGQFLLNTWDRLEVNDFSRVAHQTVARFFSDNPPNFYETPFSLHNPDEVISLLNNAGFDHETAHVSLTTVGSSAKDAARGLVKGTPLFVALSERRPEAIDEIADAVAAEIALHFGDPPRGKMWAFVFDATK